MTARATCPECGATVDASQPYWTDPATKQRHHDPCPAVSVEEVLEQALTAEYGEQGWRDLRSLRRIVTALADAGIGPIAEARAAALEEAAADVRHVRENGLPEGVHSHPTAEHFEQWLLDRAGSAQGGRS